ncbi:LacI family DNA-binding transcriptional regulator [Devosia sp.]|jgi:DNA-binding LacI/PurR family transcriptional regulator|uniref:LacI family DNA-binding transcriptional regulator n=1 Tax=Devosia sp. TaxID=1871048 RepID=UPI0037BF1BD8
MAPRQKSDRVTIKTVAEDAGVSVSAVSKVLRDAYGVSGPLRERVRASMEKLGYRPHAAARGMRGQTYTLGVHLPDIHNPFFTDIMAGMNSALERTQYQTLVGISQSNITTQQALLDAMIDRQMDGIIFIGPRLSSEMLDELAERIPLVVIAHHTDSAAYDTVNNDDVLGGTLAVQHLFQAGYRNIAMISLSLPMREDAGVTIRRELGYRQAMDDAGLRRFTKVVIAEQTAREVQAAARHLLRSRGAPEAIFCWTDFIALEVLSVAKELGMSVPGDLAVVGYDNTSYCDLAQNALTSIDQSGQVLGLQSARLLIERIKGRTTAEHFVVTPRLVARNSSQPVAR